MKLSVEDDDKVEVMMSPLIDCVFLLLIFFLVTTMMKKWEMQIPLTLPSSTSSLSTKRSTQEAIIIAVDEQKNVYSVAGHDAYSGQSSYVKIRDLDIFLNELQSREGTEITVDIAAYRTVSVKTVIEIFDKFQLKGFTHTRVRLGSKPYQLPYQFK
ncbi:MAG: biopolymer transporter ExbD [Prevotellaceae bacterium]|jgi:biopolymer transport protein ExbD|nr:biopolymer transporter ExbD [Prevotellaceae bacterium]